MAAPRTAKLARATGSGRMRGFGKLVSCRPWLMTAVAVVLAAVAFVELTGMRPEYDAYGFLVWGHQAAHWNLDTSAAPSWKPLPFLFTFALAPAGRAQLWLWMVTAVAAAFLGGVFAARIAYRLSGPCPKRPYAPVAAALFAGFGVLGIENYWHYILIANADPMVVTLCLGAIDSHLSRRPKLAWLFLVLASLGRPEALAWAGLYALWAWRRIPSMRAMVAAGLVLIPAMWFGIAGLTSHSWTIASDVALGTTNSLSGNKFAGVIRHLRDLYELPMQLAVLFALVLAVVRRDRASLLVAGAALVWLAVEVAMAYHGWNVPSRYLFAPGAVLVVLVGATVGRVLAITSGSTLLRIAVPAAVLALVVALAPHARVRARLLHNELVFERVWTRELSGLHALIAREGGARRIVACGQAVTDVGMESILAWELDENVVAVGWDPTAWIRAGAPIVLFEPQGAGWTVRPIHTRRARGATCGRLATRTAFR